MGVSLTQCFSVQEKISISTSLESFPSTFTERSTDTSPMCLNPNGLQNTTKPHQNMSRNRPRFKYSTFYKVIMIPKSFTLSAAKQRRLCTQTPICEQVQQPKNRSIAVMAKNSKFKPHSVLVPEVFVLVCCRPP